MRGCKQCGEAIGEGVVLCKRCHEFNVAHPIPPGARRWSGRAPQAQNLPREGWRDSYSGTIAENLVQTAIAEEFIANILADATPAGDGALSDTFTAGGGDFGGGGASGDW